MKNDAKRDSKQKIRNIKAGQKFIIIDVTCEGFEVGCIVEAIEDINNVIENAGEFKWIGGYEPQNYNYKDVTLTQYVEDLKRYKGKIK